MPIKAKYNGSYKDITDLMNVDESIDYVLAKTSSSYKRVYTATRSIEGIPPMTFKSIKPGANLTDYRIYGNTSKNILPLSKTPKTETIGDILCEYDGMGTFKFTSNVDNPTYTQDQWFWVPFEEDFDFPVGISDGGHGCIQLNNDFATEHGVTPYLVGFANRDNGEFVSGFNVAGTALNIIDTNYEVEDLEGLPANCIAFLYLHQIGKRTVTIKPALYLDIRTRQPFEPYGESVGDRTGNLFDEAIYNKNVQDNMIIYVPIYVGNIDYVTYSTTCPKTNNSRYIFIFSGNVNTGAKNEINGVSNGAPRTIRPSNGYVTIAYRKIEGYNVRPWEYQTMLNAGSTALPYEPYGYKVPVTVSNGTDTLTTPIYLPEPIKMVGDEAEYIDYGEQKQHRVRKNLLPNTATSQTINGVTFTVNSDGSVTCNTDENGATTGARFYLVGGGGTNFKKLNINANAIITGCPLGGNTKTYSLFILRKNDDIEPPYYNTLGETGNGFNLSYNETNEYIIYINISTGTICNNLTFYPMIRNADITDDTYEPYIENTDIDVTLPALPTLPGTNVLSVRTEVQPSKIDITGHIKTISGGS